MILQLFISFSIALVVVVDASYPSPPMGRRSYRRQLMGMGGGGGDGACKAYKILAARGTTEPQSGGIGYRGLLRRIKSAVPNGDSREVQYSSAAEYTVGPAQGASEGLSWLRKQISKCPNQVYVFVGYSKGAMVMTQIAAKPNAPMIKVAAIGLYGNPYWRTGAPQNKCGAKMGVGIASMMMVRMPSAYVPITYDCCLTGDMICTGTGSMVAHMAYGSSSSERDTAQFIISKLKAKLGAIGGQGGGSPGDGPGPGKSAGGSAGGKSPGGTGGSGGSGASGAVGGQSGGK